MSGCFVYLAILCVCVAIGGWVGLLIGLAVGFLILAFDSA